MWRADSLLKTLMLGKTEAGGEGGDRGWDGWMASPTQCTWVWVNSGSWWWTGRLEISLLLCLIKVDGDPQCQWAPSNLLRAWIEQKCRGRLNSVSIYPWHSWCSDFQAQTGTYIIGCLALSPSNWTIGFLGLQLVDGRLLKYQLT